MSGADATLAGTVRKAVMELQAAGVPGYLSDARILVSAATGLSREDMLRDPEAVPDPTALEKLAAMIGRRAAREPVSRILGTREFRGLEFVLGPSTLDPRPDSETIVEAAVDFAKLMSRPPSVLDIGTGTGCLLLSILAALPDAQGIGTDIDCGAVEIARRNAGGLGLTDRAKFLQASWTDGIDRRFDIVVSNPPYIRSADIDDLAPEVSRHDPIGALDGGSDGLDAYRALARRIPQCLSAAGVAVLEIGAGQHDDVAAIYSDQEMQLVEVRRDLGGIPRSLAFCAEPLPEWLTELRKKGLESA